MDYFENLRCSWYR